MALGDSVTVHFVNSTPAIPDFLQPGSAGPKEGNAMANPGDDYELIVIGKGSAGEEAAKEAARKGKTTLFLQLNPGSIASVMCSTSQHGSPQGALTGVEAQLIRLEKESDPSSKLVQTKIDADSHHSVYILQSLEDRNQVKQNPQHRESSTPPPSITEKASSGEKRIWSHVLREREIHKRKRRIHRSTAHWRKPEAPPAKEVPNQTETQPPEPILRERERRLRQRLVRSRKSAVPPSDQPTAHRPQPGTADNQKRQAESQKSKQTSTVEEKRSVLTPFDKKKRVTKLATGKSPSHAVIPMDQRRLKHRKGKDLKEFPPPEPPSPTPPEPEKTHIPGAMVWEGDEKKEKPAEKRLTYEPFQSQPFEKRARPFSSKTLDGMQSSDSGYQDEPFQSGPLQGRSRMPFASSSILRQPPEQKEERKSKFEVDSGSSSYMNQEAARNVLAQSDGLKKDDISIEDPFGQSYDEIIGPFGEKNSEEEQLEKRKLALRGLHNLINNLG